MKIIFITYFRRLKAYKKAVNGPSIAERIGLNAIRKECSHFNRWIECLEKFAASDAS
ncbi:MAG: DUF4276 family protein [Candidatus Sumerlaeota bacterium]|nr:DUF4276 family protein [Candidatus Sumerlaeota bacterium]